MTNPEDSSREHLKRLKAGRAELFQEILEVLGEDMALNYLEQCAALDDVMSGQGFHNWERPESYGTQDWDLNRWRWEFLRRRPDYQAAYDTALETLKEPVELPPDVEPEDVELLLPRVRSWPFRHPEAAKFGLYAMYDPLQSNWRGHGPEWPESGLLYGEERGDELETFTFDLSRPLPPQLRELEAALSESQFFHLVYSEAAFKEFLDSGEKDELTFWEKVASKKVRSSKKHPEKWLTYLRVLDARADVDADGRPTSWARIFEVVLKPEKPLSENGAQLARGVWERAQALMKDWPA